jgi:malate synthase
LFGSTWDPARAGLTKSEETVMNALHSGHVRIANRVVADRSILTPEALDFAGELVTAFRERITDLLAQRRLQRGRVDAGARPLPLESTAWIREADWQCAPVPSDLLDRRGTIAGPADRQSIARAVTSGCRVYVAQLEDGVPTLFEAQSSLRAAVHGDLPLSDTKAGRVRRTPLTIVVRPRPLEVTDAHLFVNRRPAPAALVDAALFLFHNAHALVAQGGRPYFYLTDVQSYQEARLWNDIFLFAEIHLALPIGTIKATVRIATGLVARQMNEILYALRRHSAGLHGMMLDSSRAALVETCRRRGVPARLM